ncbi:MAG TPA: CHRD domain-containing protein [Saprospiraceae bacterium]|nr:CHRD domain-containing protein [Saprospiraceae bacterium]HRK83120.1 CHRD domain-containing protein [Saprospiraceae bacterium]
MKTHFSSLFPWAFLLFFVLMLAHNNAAAQIFRNNRILFTTDLNGGQVIPSVNNSARGIVTVLISEDRTHISINGVFHGLSGPVTACHIHTGSPTANGPVLINLSNNVSGNRLRADIPIPTVFWQKAFIPELYIDVHTAANPNGEIRGHLELMSEEMYSVILNGASEVSPVSTSASGLGLLAYSPGNFTIRYYIVVNGLSGPITAAHIHSGAIGVNGPVVTPLSQGLPNVLSGTLSTSSLPVDFFQKLIAGTLYVNVHTNAHPGGEIRGQLSLTKGLTFESLLNGDQEVPPVNSAASGAALAFLSPGLDSITYHVIASGLTPTTAHLHQGAAGVSGPVTVALQTTSLPNYYTAKVPATGNFVTQLLNSGIYVNVHTAAHPGGEIRGQLEPLLKRVYAFDICSDQVVPPTGSTAIGAAYFSTDRLNSHFVYRYIVSGLSGPATFARVHEGAPGTNGLIFFSVNLPNPVGSGQFPITGNEVQKFESGNSYLIVQTAAHPDGEIRGKIMRGLSCSINVSVEDQIVGGSALYPNPTSGETILQLQIKDSFEGELVVNDLHGRLIRKENHAFIPGEFIMQLQLSDTSPGLYVIQIRSAAAGVVWASKLIKH